MLKGPLISRIVTITIGSVTAEAKPSLSRVCNTSWQCLMYPCWQRPYLLCRGHVPLYTLVKSQLDSKWCQVFSREVPGWRQPSWMHQARCSRTRSQVIIQFCIQLLIIVAAPGAPFPGSQNINTSNKSALISHKLVTTYSAKQVH